MSKINVLPKSVAELIAAGEVVERPSSAVKELIENSVDAGADSITVEIKNGGVRYIRVTDNGSGIHREDVRTAFISHATSKISTQSDLDSIFTLGFRGEALPSIAAVSRLSLLTKTPDEDIGTSIEIHGGEEVNFDDAGCPDGTTIIVRDLFFNTPARMKFLKKDMTEGAYVSDIVSKIAVAHPEIRFSFIKDGKRVLSTPGNSDLKDTVFAVHGKEVAQSLLPCEYEYKSIKISGFISKPLSNRPNRNLQYCFVNGRYVRMSVAAAALDEAYKNTIMVGKFPMCFLFIDIPAQKTDVNVHPAKTEIRFSDDACVFEAIFYAAKNALNKGDKERPEVVLRTKSDVTAKSVPTATQLDFVDNIKKTAAFSYEKPKTEAILSEKPKNVFDENTAAKPAFTCPFSISTEHVSAQKAVFRDTSSIFNNLTPPERVDTDSQYKKTVSVGAVTPIQVETKQENKESVASFEKPIVEQEEKNSFVPEETKCEDEAKPALNFTVIGEIFKTYILVECDSKLLIIDKHAAHERMIFNKLSSGVFPDASQIMLSPVSVHLSGKEYAVVMENLEVFSKGGFGVEDFGGSTVIVRECPVTLQKEDVASVITEMAGELLRGNIKPVPEKLDWLYHSTACRAAIKAGDILKDEELQSFVEALLADDSIRYCPHGRPVMYELSRHEIEKQFGRV